MATLFNEQKWSQLLQSPDWYVHIIPEIKDIKTKIDTGELDKELFKEEVYGFFEQKLLQKQIALGTEGHNFDAERKPIDTIVIHHTHNPPGMSKARLSAMTLLRLYTSCYLNPSQENEKYIQDTPIYSGHFEGDVQVFYPYHFIVRVDGTVERLLKDTEIGWHAGNWDVNCRSIAIVLDNNYEDDTPSEVELQAIAKIIKEQYPHVPHERIFGHREINPKTTCPSNLFLSTEIHKGWKEDLLTLLT